MIDNILYNDFNYYYRKDEDEKSIVKNHIEKHFGEIDNVFTEKITEEYFIEIYHIAPTKNRFYHKLITYGVSSTKVNEDKEFQSAKFVELIVFLPTSWYAGKNNGKDIKIGWPYKMLKEISQKLILKSSYPWYRLSNTNLERSLPVADNTKQCGFIPLQPTLVNPNFNNLNIGHDKVINFFNIVPLYEEEINFRITRGIKAFEKKFYGNGETELIDINRKNVCKNRIFDFFKG